MASRYTDGNTNKRQFVYSNAVEILRIAMTSFSHGFTFHEGS